MDGKLDMLYVPVRDAKSALAFYHDQLGFEEAWREGETTIVFKLPGTDVKLMIEQHEGEITETPGPLFMLPSIDDFFAQQGDTTVFIQTPIDIPVGRWAVTKDPSGNTLYFIDFSKKEE
ncbi:MAG: VOC family protein [Ktedonobacteraceae bacterium]